MTDFRAHVVSFRVSAPPPLQFSRARRPTRRPDTSPSTRRSSAWRLLPGDMTGGRYAGETPPNFGGVRGGARNSLHFRQSRSSSAPRPGRHCMKRLLDAARSWQPRKKARLDARPTELRLYSIKVSTGGCLFVRCLDSPYELPSPTQGPGRIHAASNLSRRDRLRF